VISKGLSLHVTSLEKLLACSGFGLPNGASGVRPVASVSSVNGVGAK
jgi:hypothetical protein